MSHQHRKNIRKYNEISQSIKAQPHLYGERLVYFYICSFGAFVRSFKPWPRATDLDLAAI